MQQARTRDEQLARGQYLGWMHGFPHAVKDTVSTKGIRTTWGSPLIDMVPGTDSFLVERLKKNGAIVIGKTNTPEFAMGSQTYNPIFGTTLNAYAPAKTAGGSSGGAAAALALRMLPVADGSDIMGSLRNPAAFNNVIGFRPSYGRVPGGPALEVFVHQLGASGPMGRKVADVAMLLSVIAGPHPADPNSIEQDPLAFAAPLDRDFKQTRIGWLGNLGGYLAMEPGVMELCESSLQSFEAIGCTVEQARLAFPPEQMWDTWLTLRHWLLCGNYLPLYNDPAKRALMKPEAQWEVEGGLKLTAMDVHKASVARTGWYEMMRKLLETYDYLLLPSAQVFPFDAATHWPKNIDGKTMDTYHRWMGVVVPGSLSGSPIISMPIGFSRDGLPMGIQIIGRHHGDFAVLQIAYAYEQASGWVDKCLPPLIADS
jgi:amidase